MNYEGDRAMNPKRLRMEGEAAHGVVQGNGLPLNYMDNGHQIPYQPYAGAYNTHYPPPDAFSAYGPPPPGGYAPQNLSYAPPAHQNYAHHQSFPQQQAQLHMTQPHMVQGYAGDVGVHKWPPQHLLPTHDPQKLDVKQPKPEIKLEPQEVQKRAMPPEAADIMGDMDQPKIKIKTDIFKPDDVPSRPEPEKEAVTLPPIETQNAVEARKPDEQVKPEARLEEKTGEKPQEVCKAEALVEEAGGDTPRVTESVNSEEANAKPPFSEYEIESEGETKVSNDVYFGTPDAALYRPKPGVSPSKTPTGSAIEPKKRGRPKGSTNKPKTPPTPNRVLTPNTPGAPTPLRVGAPTTPAMPHRTGIGRPRGTGYQYAIRPFRKDFSGIQFRRRWSDDCLESAHIPNEVYFGDVPVSMEVLFNYYDAGAEREKMAAQAAQIAAQKAAAAKLAAAKLQARGLLSNEVTTVDSSSDDSSSGSDSSDSDDSDDETPLKRAPKTPKTPRRSSSSSTPGRRGRPPVPPELREPGITEMKKFCKAAGLRFDYKKLVDGCTKNKERVNKMLDLLKEAGLEGKPTLEKCQAIKKAKTDAKEEVKKKKQQAKVKPKIEATPESNVPRRMTRGQTGTKPRQKIVISSEEEDDTPDARRTLSKLRSMVDEQSASD